jgi:hypothetical protein
LYTLFLRNAGYVPKPFRVQQLEDPESCVSSIDETPVISAQNGGPIDKESEAVF